MPPYERRGFVGHAAASTLAATINASATTIAGVDLSSWAGVTGNGPAAATIDRDSPSEEHITFTGLSGNSLTGVTRGVDGTTAATHQAGVALEHTSLARDFDEANAHIADPALDHHVQYAKKATVSTPGDVLLRRASVTGANYSTVSNMALVAVDTTNLRCTFTAPATGRVIVRLTANSRNSGTSLTIWGLLEGATQRGAGIDVTSYNNDQVYSAAIEISGLVAGSSHTYDWAFTVGGGTGYVSGHPVMEVWSA